MTRDEATELIREAIRNPIGTRGITSALYKLDPSIADIYESLLSYDITADEFFEQAENALIISHTPLAQAMK